MATVRDQGLAGVPILAAIRRAGPADAQQHEVAQMLEDVHPQ